MSRRRTLLAGLGALAVLPLATACRMGTPGLGAATAGPLPPARDSGQKTGHESGQGTAKGTATMEQDGLTLQARLTPQPEANTLAIAYRIDNHGSGPAYIYDKLIVPDPKGGTKALADRAYVYPLPDQDEVLVMKDVAPVPEGMSPTSLVVPLMVRLGPGEALEGALTLSLPLKPWREYVANGSKFPRQDRVDALRLRLGYALPPEGAEESTFDYAGETAANFRNPPGTRHKAAALELRFETPGLPVYLPE